MSIAIVSDIHGNLTAFEAVVADLREMSPDLILHGGDLADGGRFGRWLRLRVKNWERKGWRGCGACRAARFMVRWLWCMRVRRARGGHRCRRRPIPSWSGHIRRWGRRFWFTGISTGLMFGG